jgi:cyclopropane fatty-acyl-phospholipid synthase-like methyltransferase
MPVVIVSDFARSFGTEDEDISPECRKLIAEKDFSYVVLVGKERDNLLLQILKRIETDKQIIGAKKRQDIWHDGWAENLEDFIKSGYDLKALVPKFIRSAQVIRYNQDYIKSANQNFELDYLTVFRTWLFQKYFQEVESVYEFGCGTGFNMVALAEIYPQKALYGLDFVKSSCDLVNRIAEAYKLNLKGRVFDMINPDENFKIANNSAVFTIGAIEQLASKFEAFLQYLLKQSPKLCVHVEPTIELYDESNLVDYLAIRFQGKRGYTHNFLPRLKELEKEKKIEILKIKRLYFGSLYMEGYNLMIWRPVK